MSSSAGHGDTMGGIRASRNESRARKALEGREEKASVRGKQSRTMEVKGRGKEEVVLAKAGEDQRSRTE